MPTTENSPLSERLTDIVFKIRDASLSDAVVAKVEQHLLDSIASAFIGCRSLTFKDMVQIGRPDSISHEGLASAWAFAINGSVSEDGSREGACHPAAGVMPVILTFGDGKPRELILKAITAGYDVMIRIARAGNPLFARKGFHGTAVTAPFGAAATLAVLEGFDREALKNALCLAALGGSGLMAAFKSGSTQPLQVAWGVRNGVAAAILAGKGHKGYERILEEGFFPAYLTPEAAETVMAPLEKEYAIEGCYLKPYPGCRHMHASLEAFSTLFDQHKLAVSDIKSITIGTYRVALETGIKTLQKRGDAYFNIPYAIAARAVLGVANYDSFDEKHFSDPDIKRLMALTTERIDPEIDSLYPGRRGAVAEIELLNGESFSHRVEYPLGEPESPLSFESTKEKFFSCTAQYLKPEEQERIVACNAKQGKMNIGDMLSERLFFNL